VQRQAVGIIEQPRNQPDENLKLNDAFGIRASGELRSPPALK
jgi:hypothetical protein